MGQDHDTYFLDQVLIPAILQSRMSLEKQIEERDERDIKLIDRLCSFLRGFYPFPETVRRALAHHIVLIVISEPGKEVLVHNEKLDSFTVLMFGECLQLNESKTAIIQSYTAGDSFGIIEPTTDKVLFYGHMITKTPNCAFLCIRQNDYYAILTASVNYPIKETIRHRDKSESIFCISQLNTKLNGKSTGHVLSFQKQSNTPHVIFLPDGHSVVEASEDFLVSALVDGYDRADSDFIHDFLLLFRVFMTQDQKDKDMKLPPGMTKLCSTLIEWLDNYDYRDRVVKTVLVWLSLYYHDFELNSDFSYKFFTDLAFKLPNDQLHLLHETLSTKSKVRHDVTITKSSREQPLPFTIAGGYEKNCGIFVNQVIFNPQAVHIDSRTGAPPIPPRKSATQNHIHSSNHDARTPISLKPGDQILEVNGTNFAAISLSEAQKKLDMSTHLSLTVKFNPSAFYEMKALPEGRRKSSQSSISSISPHLEPQIDSNKLSQNNDQAQALPSPLISTNANFGFKSFTTKHSKQLLEQLRDSSTSNISVLRVFNAANSDFRYLLVHQETTAREVVMVAVKEFNLTGSSGSQPLPGDKSVSSLNWHLYEVSVVPQNKTIKQKCLSEQTSRLAERASLCSRLYIKNNSQSSFGPTRLDVSDDTLVAEILKESPPNVTLTSLNAVLLAVELTLTDFDKFKNIEPQQFVYDTFFDYSEKDNQNHLNGKAGFTDSASLKSSSSDGQDVDLLHTMNKARSIPKSWMKEYQEFADISNKEMFWVVCEILNEPNINERVKIVKQFIKVADVCSQLRNYNSMFAIISGLGHSCVNRLRKTFEKLKPKYKNQLETMRSLFDPSKNMSNYRICLGQIEPPAIPLFPQIKKDLTFTKEGRSIFVRESNSLSDDDEFGSVFSQDTIRRRSKNDLSTIHPSDLDCAPNLPHTHSRPSSYTSYNNRATYTDSILVNFSEIRQFTKRVRNVTHFSSVPYSHDLLTNTKDNQKNQAQIKKMHEEWQMRKRIRHYINQTLNSAINEHQTINEKFDQLDGFSTEKVNSKLLITYDEKTLHQKSLEVEPELNTKIAPVSTQPSIHSATTSLSSHSLMAQPPIQPQVQQKSNLNMHPPSVVNSSPTLSQSSSLSSFSSFNHLPNCIYAPRNNNLTSSRRMFDTENPENLRKLQALSEPTSNNGSSNGSINKSGKWS